MFCPHCESEGSHEREEGDRNGEMTVCPNCGGEVRVETHTSAARCGYCDSYLIFNERVEGQYAPQTIIPFQMGKEACKSSIREKFKRCLFAPVDFLAEVRMNSMEGIYVPYWFFDYDTHCLFQGEGTRVRVWRSGDTEYTETSYYAVTRDMDIPFRSIPADASEAMPDQVMELIAPFDYGKQVSFAPEYMSGFYAEKYNMLSGAVESRARKVMEEDAAKLLRQSCSGYHSLRTVYQDSQVRDSRTSYGLVPVWKYIYSYRDKEYPFYVNGQTGKIVGTAPVAPGRVWAYAGTLWACLASIGVLSYLILMLF